MIQLVKLGEIILIPVTAIILNRIKIRLSIITYHNFCHHVGKMICFSHRIIFLNKCKLAAASSDDEISAYTRYFRSGAVSEIINDNRLFNDLIILDVNKNPIAPGRRVPGSQARRF